MWMPIHPLSKNEIMDYICLLLYPYGIRAMEYGIFNTIKVVKFLIQGRIVFLLSKQAERLGMDLFVRPKPHG